ncbi:MAG: hypothetical protein HKN70_08750 [Gammaproteobacteria bacterium]|nr:hypothetical protein [Gammaproteobacteria bacterium]
MPTDQQHEDMITPAIPFREWCWRLGWTGLRLVMVYIMADQFQPFFYQAF